MAVNRELAASCLRQIVRNCAEIIGSLHVKFCRATSAQYNINGRPPACWIATCFLIGYKPWLSKHVQKKYIVSPFLRELSLFLVFVRIGMFYELHLTDCYAI